MNEVLHLDFETRSALDLKEVGLENYLAHHSTSVICMAYAFGNEPVDIWTPGEPIPERISKHIYEGGTVVAHNAVFEMLVWNRLIRKDRACSPIVPKMCDCTMARSYAMALPGALFAAAAALGISEGKDMAGHRLMLQMCKPRKELTDGTYLWWDDAERLGRLYKYCVQDVVVEREVFKRTVPLNMLERKVWEIDAKINRRGMPLDINTVKKAIKIVELERERLCEKIVELTKGAIHSPTQNAAIVKWIAGKGHPEISSIGKDLVVGYLKDNELNPEVKKILYIRQEAGRSSIAKLYKMVSLMSKGNRVRDQFQYCGAGKTGRWAGRDLQPHNFPKPTMKNKDILHAFEIVETAQGPNNAIDFFSRVFSDSVTEVLVNCIRGMVCGDLSAGDFSNIEGRGLAWLAGEEWKLRAFEEYDIGIGPDLYLVTAAKIYHTDPGIYTKESPEREVGKRCELAFGYEGGVGAWRKFENYATEDYVPFSDEKINEIKNEWRYAHPNTVDLWSELNQLAMAAVLNPNSTFIYTGKNAKLIFYVDGSFLWCRLPSGRNICYPYPQIDPVETPWGELRDALTYMKQDGLTHQFVRTSTYGGKLTENIVQAMCRDLLADAMVNLDDAGYKICLHIHDEIVCENVKDKKPMEKLLGKTRDWAKGLPVVADVWQAKRYKK